MEKMNEREGADRYAEATREEMSAAKLPLAYRDSCAHLLIPLNKCRYDNYYLSWRCQVRKPHVARAVNTIQTDSENM